MEIDSGSSALAVQHAPFTDSMQSGPEGLAAFTPAMLPEFDFAGAGESELFPFSVPAVPAKHGEPLTMDRSQDSSDDGHAAAEILRTVANQPTERHNSVDNDVPTEADLEVLKQRLQTELDDARALRDLAETRDPQAYNDAEYTDRTQGGYAMLCLPDGDYFVRTHNVMIGRNMHFYRDWKKAKRAERRAKDTLQSYRQEPSQPSQPGDHDQPVQASSSNQSLEGRPAPASTASQQGGAIYFTRSDDDFSGRPMSRRKRNSFQLSKSSSANSVAPWSLHPQEAFDDMGKIEFDEDGEPLQRTYAYVPVHPPTADDIRLISREHLMIRFNFQLSSWEMVVLGTQLQVGDRVFQKGQSCPMHHLDVISIKSLTITFKLPNNYTTSDGMSRGTFDSDVEDEVAYELHVGVRSRGLELTDAFEDDDELDIAVDEVDEEDESEEDEEVVEVVDAEQEEEGVELDATAEPEPRRRPKTNIKAKRPTAKEEPKAKKVKDKGKGKGKEKAKIVEKGTKGSKPGKTTKKEPAPELLPEASKKPEKAKKPKPEVSPTAGAAAPREPPQFAPGSVLANLPPAEVPARRKGPGRPPKNGAVSKRDEGLIARKQKEYAKRGEAPPPFLDLLEIVRAESKAAERQKKIDSGRLPADSTVVQSIETDATIVRKPTPGPSTQSASKADSTPVEPARKSPKPKRTARTPSPVAPQESFTEEQLKKPSITYYYILNEILTEHPDQQADLQELYLLIQKKYPHFKYVVDSHGWQSSVRHNLLQHTRFNEVGKSGKGKFWAINHDEPLEKEKKRRMTPPRVPAGQGPYMQQPHGMGQAYGNPYAQGPPGHVQYQNGQQPGPHGNYYSPYNAGGPYPPQHGQSNGQNMTYPRPSQQRGPHAVPYQPRPPPPLSDMDRLISEIMQWRDQYMLQFMDNGNLPADKDAVFSGVMLKLSDCYHGHHGLSWETKEVPADFTQEQRAMWDGLLPVFDRRYQPKAVGASHAEQAGTAGATPQGEGSVQRAVREPVGGVHPPQANGVAQPPPQPMAMNSAQVPQPAPTNGPLWSSRPLGANGAPAVAPPTVNGGPMRTPEDAANGQADAMRVEVAPPAESQLPPATNGGVKRPAEDDVDGETDAKRVKGA